MHVCTHQFDTLAITSCRDWRAQHQTRVDADQVKTDLVLLESAMLGVQLDMHTDHSAGMYACIIRKKRI